MSPPRPTGQQHTGSHTPVTWHTGPFAPVSVSHTVQVESVDGTGAAVTDASITVKADRRLAGRSAIRSALRRGLAMTPTRDRASRAELLRRGR